MSSTECRTRAMYELIVLVELRPAGIVGWTHWSRGSCSCLPRWSRKELDGSLSLNREGPGEAKHGFQGPFPSSHPQHQDPSSMVSRAQLVQTHVVVDVRISSMGTVCPGAVLALLD